jgi:intracellular multiplication protein IcmK
LIRSTSISSFYGSSFLALATAFTLAMPALSFAQPVASTGDSTPPVVISAPKGQGAAMAEAYPSAATSSGISIPTPPPSATIPPVSGINNDAAQLAAQAEQAALQAQAEADAAQAKRELEHNRKSYNRASTGLLPLSPDQVRTFMRHLQQTQESAVPPYEGQPKGKVRIATVSLDPGAEAPVIHLAAGYVTTINILDASGEPWPILDVGVGGNFDVSPTKADMHIVRIMPLTRYSSGNISILLKDLTTPVVFRLVADTTSDIDLRFDARVPKYGPSAKIPLVDHSRLEAGDETIMAFLQNLPPKDAKRIKIGGVDGRTLGWSLGDKVYVRTPLSLLSPAWNASVNSSDGMTVYEIGDAPVLLMSDNGAVLRAHILRDDDHDR